MSKKLVQIIKTETPNTLFALKTPTGWYLESPDDQALTDDVPQICILRVFKTFEQAELYVAAVSPFMGKMNVVKVSEASLRMDHWRINNFSRSKFNAPTDVVHSAIAPYEWPRITSVCISHKEVE